ncbi:MAG: hypothetical protein HY537_04980 [Deltaproteobacteria bacterium]|nr:hypothetical protein [Deltaproteobacteria bacterium]
MRYGATFTAFIYLFANTLCAQEFHSNKSAQQTPASHERAIADTQNTIPIPCDPSQIKKPIEIVLSSEWHHDPSDFLNYNRKTGWTAGTRVSRKALLVTEIGNDKWFLPPNYEFLNTVEGDGEVAHSIAALTVLARAYYKHQLINVGVPLADIVAPIIGMELAAWKKLSRPFKEKTLEDLATEIDLAIKWVDDQKKGKQKDEKQKEVEQLIATLMAIQPIPPSLALKLIDQLYEAHIKTIDPADLAFKEIRADLLKNPLSKIVADKALNDEFNSKIFLGVRDRNLASSALKQVCSAAKTGADTVVVQLGLAHTLHTDKLLRDAIKRSGLTDKVSVVIDARVLHDARVQKLLSNEPKTEADMGNTAAAEAFINLPPGRMINLDSLMWHNDSGDKARYPEDEFRRVSNPNGDTDKVIKDLARMLNPITAKSMQEEWNTGVDESWNTAKKACELAKEFAGIPKNIELTPLIGPRSANSFAYPDGTNSNDPLIIGLFDKKNGGDYNGNFGDILYPVGKIVFRWPSLKEEAKTAYTPYVEIQFHPNYLKKVKGQQQ